MDIKDKIIQNIKDKDIKPTPKIYFIIKNIIFWSFWLLCVVIGSMAMSAIIFLIQTSGWEMRGYAADSLFEFTMKILPYFWIVLFLMFITVGYLFFKNVKGVYRYKIENVIAFTLLLSIILGIGLSKAQMGMILDRAFEKRMPIYHEMRANQMKIWNKPEKGVLIGEVKIVNPDHFILGCGCKDWNVYGEPSMGYINIQVFGERINETDFHAVKIIPVDFIPHVKCERKYENIRINR